jgi:hypothetical protein
MRERENNGGERQPYPAEKARQGRIVLRNRGQRLIFIAGLVGMVVLVLVARI